MENNIMRCPQNLTASPKELRSLFGPAPMPSTGSTTPDHEKNLIYQTTILMNMSCHHMPVVAIMPLKKVQ